MGLFDALNVANQAMSVHSYRSQVAAENIANAQTPGSKRQIVELGATDFAAQLSNSRNRPGGTIDPVTGPTMDAQEGAVGITSVHTESSGKYDERQQMLMATSDMMQAKSAYELNVKSATLLKSMALAALEIGRGS